MAIPELEPEAFVAFLADLWRERGWETTVRPRPDETYFVVGKRADGKRGVLYVFPTAESHVGEQHLKKFVRFCRAKGIDVGVVATQGAYAGGAKRIAKSQGIHLLNRETLAGTVEEGGFEHVLAEYTGGGSRLDPLLATLRSYGMPVPETLSLDVPGVDAVPGIGRIRERLTGDGAGSAGDDDAASAAGDDGDRPASADGGQERALPGPLTSVPRPNVVLPAALLVLVVFLVGSAVGPALGLPTIAGDAGADGPSVSAFSTAGANATADVRWNARTTETLVVNGTTYESPDGEAFVLVRMNVTNADEESPMTVDAESLALDVDGERYGHQPLNGTTGFDQAGLFAPGEPREVWVAFTVPSDAASATLVVRTDDPTVRFTHDDDIAAEATESAAS